MSMRKDNEVQTERREPAKELDFEQMLKELNKGYNKKSRSKKNRRRDKK